MRLHLDTAISKPLDAGQTNAASSAGASSGVRSGGSSGAKDSVGISGLAAALKSSSADRASRIQQLSAAVANGSYKVPSSAISSAIVGQAIS